MKALIVIAHEGFQDYEFSGTAGELRKAGIDFEVASTRSGICVGIAGTEIEAKDVDRTDAGAFDAVVFIGGSGTAGLRVDGRIAKLAKKFFDDGKIVAAICWAPTILAKAGILKGKKATVWFGNDPEYGMDTGKVLEKAGARFENKTVVEDGKIITANGPAVSKEFGKRIAEKLGR